MTLESSAVRRAWHVPYFSLAHRVETLGQWLKGCKNPVAIARIQRRIEVLTGWHGDHVATLIAQPLVDRAPALARWAQKVQRALGSDPLALAAAHEVEALAWEEAGDFERGFVARRNAAHALGAKLDLAGFHTEPADFYAEPDDRA